MRIQVLEVQHSFSPGKTRVEEKTLKWESLTSEFSLYLLCSWVNCTQLRVQHETPVIFSVYLPRVQILQGEDIKTNSSNFVPLRVLGL